MKAILLLVSIILASTFQAHAVVVVTNSNTNIEVNNNTPIKIAKQKKIKKNKFSLKKLFSKVLRFFDFDLSDPVDGWLSLAIILIIGAIVLILLGSILSLSILSLIGSILAVGALVSFFVWVLKMI